MVDQEHARIILQKNGRYVLQDNHSRHGTSVNLKRVSDRVELKDGDLIRIGPNSIRFQERRPQPVETEPSSKNPIKAAPSPQVVSTAAPQPIAKSTSRDQKPSAKTTKGPQAAPPVPPTITETLPRGMTRCPSCRRLVTGSRPFCVHCKLAL
jgi:pSer/pThr/pTyr-binding forkhead associated (FHA) protein